MKRILFAYLTTLAMLASGAAWAQERTVSGRVISAEDGSPLPGVNVVVKGTTNGTVTDVTGNYTLNVPAGGTLIFSFIGLRSQEIPVGERSTVDVTMQQDAQQLSEVVVTALGIERNRNELPYAAQEVRSEEVTRTRNSNFVNALSGKVAGLDIKANNTMGGSTNVVIRGYKSITGNNQALFVIDGVPVSNANTNTTDQRNGRPGTDFGNAAADINPDNIASINVLKGAAATALYGSRAANGVIMITTKKGRKNTLDVAVNTGITFGQIDKSTFARYQKEYGGGYFPSFKAAQADFGDGMRPVVRFNHDASFGPRFDGQLVYQWDALDPYSPNYGKATPWVAAENDPSTFYETSVNSNQSITISGGTDKATVKFGYTRVDEKGVLPNSRIDKDLINFTTTYDVTERLKVTASANYSRIVGVGRYGTGYSGGNPNQQFRQWWQTNVDVKQQREAFFRNNLNVTWNWADNTGSGPIYSDNPYWTRYKNYSNDSRDHLFGYVSANYKITDWFDIMGRVAFDGTSDIQEERIAIGSAELSEYERFNREFNETNFDLILNFKKDISEDISFTGLLGSNLRRSRMASIRASTNGGLVVPDFYALANSRNAIEAPIEEAERIGVDGIFASASFGFKELVFVDLAARQDKSTTLPTSDNTYFYPSVAAGFVFSNLVKTPWMNHGKFRVNYAEVGSDAPAMSLFDVYDKPASLGSIPIFSLPNTKNNADLVSERTKSFEVGLDAEFFEGRAGFDVTWYKSNTLDQIIPVSTTSATGYTARYVNSGEVENKGIEIAAYGTPVQVGDFSWTLNLTFTRNRNKVLELYRSGDVEVTNVQIGSFQGGVTTNAAVGHAYGVIRGTDFVYHENGQPIVNSAGYYMASASSGEIIGDPNPDWLGGIGNTLKYKGVRLNFLIDIRHGGDIFSLDQWYGEGTGLYSNSVGLNDKGNPVRNPVSEGGGILLPGVKQDGSPNDIYAENIDGAEYSVYGYVTSPPRAWYVYDGSYVKLREVALTYSLPESLIQKLRVFKGIDVSLVGRNLWIIDKNMEYADPEETLTSGNGTNGYQSGAYPAVRTYGFNVKFNL